jgi:hypothetical protein
MLSGCRLLRQFCAIALLVYCAAVSNGEAKRALAEAADARHGAPIFVLFEGMKPYHRMTFPSIVAAMVE